MQLILKQYLSLLRESQELDILLPDLLLSMGIDPISRAQTGPRQYGVDVAAVGNDDQGVKTFFIFTIKQGDIGRKDWDDGTPQSVRASLVEIEDVYISTHIENKYKDLPKKIVVCTGGEKKQEITQNWSQFVNKNQIPGKLTYDFWGGDTLALLIEKYLFSEAIIPAELQSSLRKTLALLGNTDYSLDDYQKILDALLRDTAYGDLKKVNALKKFHKTIRTINLCQNIIFKWAGDEGNLSPAIDCSERTILKVWGFIRKHDLCENKKVIRMFYELYQTLYRVYVEYLNKVQGHAHVRDGFCGYGQDHIQENLNLFRQLGLISTTGLICLFNALATKDQSQIESTQNVAISLKAFIDNHKGVACPVYDGHIIEISEAIFFLGSVGEAGFVSEWISSMLNHIVFAYHSMHKYFPIQTDSFDDLTALNISGSIEKEKLFKISTLLPTLAYWSVALGLAESYFEIKRVVAQYFPDCDLQVWYPDAETDKHLYDMNASGTGAMDAPIELPDSIEELKKRVGQIQKNTISLSEISAISSGFPVIPILASRHYRTPFIPVYWQSLILD